MSREKRRDQTMEFLEGEPEVHLLENKHNPHNLLGLPSDFSA
jgi:hypothetical protein